MEYSSGVVTEFHMDIQQRFKRTQTSAAPATKSSKSSPNQEENQKKKSMKNKLSSTPVHEPVKKVKNLSFNEQTIIGSTESSKVYSGQKEDGTKVAIKKIAKEQLNIKHFENKLKLLQDLKLESKHIVRYEDLAEDEHFYYIALQLCKKNLVDHVKNLKQKGKENVREMLLGLQVLHTAGVIHCDLKPSNVVIDKTVKLTDYGISCKPKKSSSTAHADTQSWEATEILNGTEESHTKSSDIQVAGMLVYYILSDRKHPFGDENCEENIKEGNYSLDDVDVKAKDLIEWMINIDPKKRPTIDEVLQHSYLLGKKRVNMWYKNPPHRNSLKDYMAGLREKIITKNAHVIALKKVLWEVLHDLKTHHNAGVTHCDLKLSNIVIGLSNARLADYGISCKPKKSSSTANGDTQNWEATEILNGTEESQTKSSNVQVAGMLVYYILSDGKHPFGDKNDCVKNIKEGNYSLDDVEDIVAKDLIEWMINKDPNQRPTIDEVLQHPFFWDKRGKEKVIRKLSDREEVQSYKLQYNKLKELHDCVKKHSEKKTFSEWKSKIPWKHFGDLPEDLLGLLCFFRIILVQEEMFLIEETFDHFPDFFISLHRLAKERKWEY